jgi:hypothetical protein
MYCTMSHTTLVQGKRRVLSELPVNMNLFFAQFIQ